MRPARLARNPSKAARRRRHARLGLACGKGMPCYMIAAAAPVHRRSRRRPRATCARSRSPRRSPHAAAAKAQPRPRRVATRAADGQAAVARPAQCHATLCGSQPEHPNVCARSGTQGGGGGCRKGAAVQKEARAAACTPAALLAQCALRPSSPPPEPPTPPMPQSQCARRQPCARRAAPGSASAATLHCMQPDLAR